VTELHALIDKVLYVERTNIPRPMAATDWTTLQAKTSYYQTTYETSCCSNASVYNNQDFVAWQEEAYQIATTWYDGVTEN